jgi:hypothetical protein
MCRPNCVMWWNKTFRDEFAYRGDAACTMAFSLTRTNRIASYNTSFDYMIIIVLMMFRTIIFLVSLGAERHVSVWSHAASGGGDNAIQ